MEKNSTDTINHTISFWKKLSGKMMSYEEARQAIENIGGFFQVLSEWERTEQDLSRKHVES